MTKTNQVKAIARLALLLFSLGAVEISYAADSDLAGQFYERALMQYHKGNTKEAILELKNARKENPEHVAVEILLAKAYLKEKNLVLMEVALSKADKLGADPSLLIAARAQLYLYQLKFNQLLKEIVPDKFNKSLWPDLHVYRGHAFLQLNELGAALNEYKIAARLDQNRVEGVVGQANVLLRLGDILAARLAADQAMLMQPDSIDGRYIDASINHAQGHHQKALEEYNWILEHDPQHQDARIARAGLLIDLERDDEAETDLVYLRESFPLNAKAAYLHALVLSRNNRESEAKQALLAAAEVLDRVSPKLLSKHSKSLLLAGLINFKLKRLDLAMHYFEIYSRQYPNKPGPYRLMASILLDRGENEKVIKLLKPIMPYASNDSLMLYLLGNAYMRNGQHDKANELLEKVTDLGIKGMDIHTELGLNRLAMGQDDLAIKKLKRALEQNPGNSRAGIPLTILYMNQRQPEKAMAVAEKLSEQAEDNLTLLNLLGKTQVAAGKLKRARTSYEKAIARDPAFIGAQINLSILDFIEKKPDLAKQRLNELIAQYPDNVALLIGLARIHTLETDYDNATDTLKKALKLDTNSLSAKLALIEVKFRAGRYPEALSLALEAQIQHRDNLQVLDLLARSYMLNDNRARAAGTLQIMSRLAGFNAKQLYQIARKQFAVNDYSAAIKSLKNAVLGNEDHIPARIALAEAELQYGEAVYAHNHAKFLMDRFPEQAIGYRLLGDILQKEGKQTQAIQHYKTALDKGQTLSLMMKLYSALKQAGDNSQALQLIEKWVIDHKQDGQALQILAEEYLLAGRLRDSQKYFEQLLQHNEKRVDFLNNLAYIYFIIGDDRALSYAQQAQQLAPDLPSVNDTLGWILVNNDQVERGLHYLRNAHARLSLDPEIGYHIAVALYKLQRYEEAKIELEQALKINSSFNGSEHAKQLLEALSKATRNK